MEILTMKEANRYHVISETNAGHLKNGEAGKMLDLSERQVYRIKSRVKDEGIKGIIHRSKGRRLPRWLTDRVIKRIGRLFSKKYSGFNITHFTEYLNDEEEIKVSRESVRQILLKLGLYEVWKERDTHRQRREPSLREGQMVQFDTSEHDWLEGRGERIYLIGGIDDATGKCVGARFAYGDTVIENMKVLKSIVEENGIPLIFYCDRDTNFKITKIEGVHVKFSKEQGLTQIGRALSELGVKIIYANSPQAKGRVERLWGTFQDRLCSELRLYKISTLEDANKYLWEKFIPKHNKKFSHPAKEDSIAYMTVPRGVKLEDVFCIKAERTVAKDNTVSFQGKILQILPDSYRVGYTKAKVMVYKHLDRTLSVWYKNNKLNIRPIGKQKAGCQEDDLQMVGT